MGEQSIVIKAISFLQPVCDDQLSFTDTDLVMQTSLLMAVLVQSMLLVGKQDQDGCLTHSESDRAHDPTFLTESF